MHTKQYSINSVLTVDLIPRFRYRRKRHKNLASCISGSNRCSTSNKVDDAHPAYHIAPTQLTAGPGTLDEHSKNPSDGETTLTMQRCYPLGRKNPLDQSISDCNIPRSFTDRQPTIGGFKTSGLPSVVCDFAYHHILINVLVFFFIVYIIKLRMNAAAPHKFLLSPPYSTMQLSFSPCTPHVQTDPYFSYST